MTEIMSLSIFFHVSLANLAALCGLIHDRPFLKIIYFSWLEKFTLSIRSVLRAMNNRWTNTLTVRCKRSKHEKELLEQRAGTSASSGIIGVIEESWTQAGNWRCHRQRSLAKGSCWSGQGMGILIVPCGKQTRLSVTTEGNGTADWGRF